MSGTLRWSRLAPRAALLRFWQTPAKTARLNATGLTAIVIETTLPFNPELSTVDAAQGEFRLERPTVNELDSCATEESYYIGISLVDAGGNRVEECRLWARVE